MQSLNISDRLARVAAYVPVGATFADIGSDHAYLPCYVCKNDPNAYAVAGEINNGPYLRAKHAVDSFGLTERIDVRLGNGLHVLYPDEVNHVVLSGMGATLICDILHEGMDKLHTTRRIIAQPNTGEAKLRTFLLRHRYELVDEELIEENGHVYEVIVADKKEHVSFLTDKEVLFGPHLLLKRTSLFYKKWKHEHRKRQEAIGQMKKAKNKDSQKINRYVKELTWIEEVLDHE